MKFEDPEPPIKFQSLLIAVRGGGSVLFERPRQARGRPHPIRKHQPPLLNDDMKLVDHPPVRVGAAGEVTSLLVRTEDNKGLMPIP